MSTDLIIHTLWNVTFPLSFLLFLHAPSISFGSLVREYVRNVHLRRNLGLLLSDGIPFFFSFRLWLTQHLLCILNHVLGMWVGYLHFNEGVVCGFEERKFDSQGPF